MKSKTLLVGVALALVSVAPAKSDYLDVFTSHYSSGNQKKLEEKSCAICHVSEEDFSLNPYGVDISKAKAEANASEVTAAVLTSVEAKDSDGDGKSNGEEITAGTEPGNGAVGGVAGAAGIKAPPPVKKKAQFPPKNGFHPAIVHFPIGLFIAGLLLDLFGVIRRDKTMLLAGWYNLVMAAVTAMGGIASGVLAMTLMKLPYRGLIFTHIIWALSSAVIMWILVFMRLHRHEKINVPARVIYYLLAGAAMFILSWAGHLGGAFVYGE